MKLSTCNYVKYSELFKDLAELSEEFCNSDPPFSWGDNDRTLVFAAGICSHLKEHVKELDKTSISGTPKLNEQMKELERRVAVLPDGAMEYVDLEN